MFLYLELAPLTDTDGRCSRLRMLPHQERGISNTVQYSIVDLRNTMLLWNGITIPLTMTKTIWIPGRGLSEGAGEFRHRLRMLITTPSQLACTVVPAAPMLTFAIRSTVTSRARHFTVLLICTTLPYDMDIKQGTLFRQLCAVTTPRLYYFNVNV